MLALTTGTGMIQSAQEQGRGPLAAVLAGPTPAGGAEAGREGDEEEDEAGAYGEREGFIGGEEGEEVESGGAELHIVLANLTRLLIVVHIVGVLYSGWAHQENRVRAMITGRKHPEPSAGGD